MSIKSNKILIFSTAYKPFVGGSEIAIEQVTRHLPDIFFDIVTPKYKNSLKDEEMNGNVRINRVGFGLKIDKYIFPILGYLKGRKLVKKENYKIIHAYQASFGAIAAKFLKLSNSNLKFIVTLQEGEELDRQFFLKRFFRGSVLRSADKITAISNYLANYAKRFNKKAEIKVIPNGVNKNNFPASLSLQRGEQFSKTNFQIKEKLEIKNNENIIISVSRLVQKNGIEDLIDAFQVLRDEYKMDNTKLILVGDGNLRGDIEKKIKDLKLEKHVKMIGTVSYEKVFDYLAEADVFVRPSYSEGLGNSFLEAMAVEVPIVGTRVGGIPDFLKDRETGLFADVGDVYDIADKIRELLINKDLRNNIIRNSLVLINEKYNWNKVAREFQDLYERNK